MEFLVEREKDKSGLIITVGNFSRDEERKGIEQGRGRGSSRRRNGGSESGKEKLNCNGLVE